MPILSVSITNFRNLINSSIDVLGNEVFLVGKNAQGKTNFLESLYLSAYGVSFRTKKDEEICKKNFQEYAVSVLFKDFNEKTHTIRIISKNKKRLISKNLKRIKDRKELVNTIPCVLFCHGDMDFVIGSPERKRFFIDQTVSMYNTEYINVLRNFTKILKTRNLSLKEKKTDLLNTLDEQFAHLGLNLIYQRQKTIKEIKNLFSIRYEQISGIKNVYIHYESTWKTEDSNKIIDFLIKNRNRDIHVGRSLSGPQRDKIIFLKDEKPFIPTASTGQQRLIAIVLRSVQAEYYTQKTKIKPILLLDDILLELDQEKRKIFMKNLPQYDQIFCTFLPGEPFQSYKTEKTIIYFVNEGQFNAENL